MPQQLLHHLELSPHASQQGRVGVPTIYHAELAPLFRVPDYCRVAGDLLRLKPK